MKEDDGRSQTDKGEVGGAVSSDGNRSGTPSNSTSPGRTVGVTCGTDRGRAPERGDVRNSGTGDSPDEKLEEG